MEPEKMGAPLERGDSELGKPSLFQVPALRFGGEVRDNGGILIPSWTNQYYLKDL